MFRNGWDEWCSAREGQGREPILRVVVVDDHPMTREGQRAVLSAEGDVQIVGEADTGEEALRLVRAAAPDLVWFSISTWQESPTGSNSAGG